MLDEDADRNTGSEAAAQAATTSPEAAGAESQPAAKKAVRKSATTKAASKKAVKKAPAKKAAAKKTTTKKAAAKSAPTRKAVAADSESAAATPGGADAGVASVAGPAAEESTAQQPTVEKTAKKPTKKAARKSTRKAAATAPAGEVTASTDQPAIQAHQPPEPQTQEPQTQEPQAPEPATRSAAKKSAAKRSTAKKAAAQAPGGSDQPGAEPEAQAGADDAAGAAFVAPLFQAPQPVPAQPATPGSRDADRAAEPAAGQGSQPRAESEERTDSATGQGAGEPGQGDGDGAGTEGGSRRRRRRGGRKRRRSDTDGSGSDASADQSGSQATSGGDGDQSGRGKAEQPSKADKDKGKGADRNDKSGKGDQRGENGEQSDDSSDGQGSSTRRRRRRRRQGEGADGAADDPANTVVRVREARKSSDDEIKGLTGSTRLEAKKQRRREGRESGRRRAPIATEAEFLARRESVERTMVVRQREDLTQIAVLEDGMLVEHYVARESQTSLIGNVYLGRVQNVLPSMEAAFVDIGKGRNAVLYAGEVDWSELGKDGQPRRIESVLKSGQHVLVQVTKDPVGHKGARLTSQVSLPGRYLVYSPGGHTSGISRKLPDVERNRLKKLMKEILPDDAGVIIRTAAEGASEEELRRDVARLTARWDDVQTKVAKGKAPSLLYGEPDLTVKVVRDLFTEDFTSLVVSGDDAWDTIEGYVGYVAPDLMERVQRWDGEQGDVFASYRIDEQIAKGLERKVWLPSGGSLIIDRTEAMTVIDVNTGKFTGSGGNLEETVTKNNLEAAEEIVRQLRLRDIGGIIVIDFIDMVLESNRDLVLRRLIECLGRDRTKHQVAEVTSLGLVQMTRKRIGTGLVEAFSQECAHCHGRGLILHHEPVEPKKATEDDSHRGRRGRRRSGSGKDGSDSGRGDSNADSGSGNDRKDRGSGDARRDDRDAGGQQAAKTDAVKPDASADAARPDGGKAEPDTSGAGKAGAGKPEADTVGAGNAEAAKAGVGTSNGDKPEAGQPDSGQPKEKEPDHPSGDAQPAREPGPAITPRRSRRRAASRPAGPPVPVGGSS